MISGVREGTTWLDFGDPAARQLLVFEKRAARLVATMTKAAASNACAAVGVLLLIFAGVAPSEWYPAAALFIGLALLAVSHVLTPCLERIALLRKQHLK